MNKKAQILLITLLVLLVLAVSTIIGISLMSSKITSLSRLIERGGDWFSSVISSLEYGLYKLNTMNTPPQSEISVPYFGGENLIPFFKAPYTITIYGEQVLPIIYEGYFGFRDLIFPIQWIFKWIAKREAGVIKEVQINPTTFSSYTLPAGYYGYYQPVGTSTIICAPLFEAQVKKNIFNFAYAAIQIADCVVSSVLTDNNINSYTLLGDNASTTDCENFVLDIYLDEVKNIISLDLYIKDAYPGADIIILYWDTNLNDWKAYGVLQDIGPGWRHLGLNISTNKIRLFTNYECQVNLRVELSEVYVTGH